MYCSLAFFFDIFGKITMQSAVRSKPLQLNEEINQQEEQVENIDRFIGKVRKYLDLDELAPAVVNDMVKAVYVMFTLPTGQAGAECKRWGYIL